MLTEINIGTFIKSDPKIHGGCPIIAGTAVTVRRIVIWYKLGYSPEEIADEIPHLSLAKVYAALTYYHTNKETIEAEIIAEAAEADRIEALHYSSSYE